MNDSEILDIARAAVADHLKPLARIAVRHDAGAPTRAAFAGTHIDDDLMRDLAKRVGATLQPSEPDSADVEFVEETALGKRTTVVHVRSGKVARVVKRGSSAP